MNELVSSRSSSMRMIDAIEAPVSMAVELATHVSSAMRNVSGSRRYGLVSMSGFCSTDKLCQSTKQSPGRSRGNVIMFNRIS